MTEQESTAAQMPVSTAGPYSIGSDHWPGLSKLIEECGEVMQVAGKIIATNGVAGHWDGSDLRERLQDELGDLLAAVTFVGEINGLNQDAVFDRAEKKEALFRRWHAEQGGS